MTPQLKNRGTDSSNRPGRRPATSREELEEVAFELFQANGFEETSVDDIARRAGIARRTFFRYFDSKNDVVWGAFDEQLHRMRREFLDRPGDQALMDAIRTVVVACNRVEPGEEARHRRRLELIMGVPVLQAYSTLRYAEWRAVIAEFAAGRLGPEADSLLPRSLAHAVLGVALAAHEHWLERPESDLCAVLDSALRQLARGFHMADNPGWC
ncbi:mycofactocin system transcriptional regulator [Streptomyces sp. NPDC001530]|uniref:mycofactocin system transcriptional regulator n=1 Tax=Streptomyces sp. NPDC001530 TaxID=3364582 RepID=UPI003680B8AB